MWEPAAYRWRNRTNFARLALDILRRQISLLPEEDRGTPHAIGLSAFAERLVADNVPWEDLDENARMARVNKLGSFEPDRRYVTYDDMWRIWNAGLAVSNHYTGEYLPTEEKSGFSRDLRYAAQGIDPAELIKMELLWRSVDAGLTDDDKKYAFEALWLIGEYDQAYEI